LGLASLAPAAGSLLLAAGLGSSGAEAKTPGKSYCFYGKCHRVKTISETEALVGQDATVMASHYDSCKRDRYNPCGLTSSGEAFNSESPDNAASPVYPDGTTLLVRSPTTKVSLVVRVNNAGPYWGNRTLDLSRKAAEVLGFAGQGVAKLEVRVIDAPTVAEATYKRNRKYDPVPGHIGTFASLDEAQTGAATAYMVAGLKSPFPDTTVVAALGQGNPTQAQGSVGTQSGATPPLALVPRTTLAALAPQSVDQAAASVEPVAAVSPAKVAGFVAVAEVEAVTSPAKPVRVASLDAAQPVRSSVRQTEARNERNSRAYRKAAQQKKQRNDTPRRNQPAAVVAVAEPPRVKAGMTQDGTNDMSVFSRHRYAGLERYASPEPQRRRQAYAMRDDG
jgi:rare lipoprotein A